MSFSCLDVALKAGLHAGRQVGREHTFRCPHHEDARPSLTINVDKNAWMCGPCGAQGTAFQLAAFIAGYDPSDKVRVIEWCRAQGLINGNGAAPHAAAEPTRTIVQTYDYRDEQGTLLYQAVRLAPKGFYRRRPDGAGGWLHNLDGVRLVPYGLDRLVDATPDLVIVEGEKDVDRCLAMGVIATTGIGGAGQGWREAYTQDLVVRAGVVRATLVSDYDEPGVKFSASIAHSLAAAGVEVRVVRLPGLHDGPLLPAHGKDISDWFDAGHTVAEFQAQVALTPVWAATTSEPTNTTHAGATTFTAPAHWRSLDLAKVATWKCEPLRPIVDGLIAHGNLVYIAAETQTGKTLLTLNIARQLVQGQALFGKLKITPVGKLLYFVLEDPDRRIQDRLLDMQQEFPASILADRCKFEIAPGFNLTDDRMCQWLEQRIIAEQIEVVVLDTYQKATPGISSFDDEKQSLILHKLADLTRRLHVTFAILDHVRKQQGGAGRRKGELAIDDIKGTGGKPQNADCVILMERTPDKKQIRFQAFSKDFDQPVRMLINVAPRGSTGPKFTYAADLEVLGTESKARGEKRREQILMACPVEGLISVAELAAAVGLSESTVKRHLRDLVTAGQLDVLGEKRWTRYRRIVAEQ